MASDLIVQSRAGLVRGVRNDGMRVWRGIPYARPPLGDLRHRFPLAPPPWSGVRDATETPARAMQSDPVGALVPPGEELPPCSEDCLYLNVSAPEEPAPVGGYPVLVWFHGGGYMRGWSNGAPVRDGATFVRRGIVVVTVNYRLGALGFLALQDLLGADAAEGGSAGLADQVAALRWVAENIAAFDGDPGQVTIYGISAGGKSITNLLGSPLTAGLITRAICSSGGEYVATPAQAASVRRRLLEALGLSDDSAGKVRDVPASELLAAQESLARPGTLTWVWRPCLGGAALPIGPIEAVGRGAAAGVPLLVGNNGNEGLSYQALEPTVAAESPRVLREMFGATDAAAILEGYAAAYPDLDEAAVNLLVFGDERYAISTHHLANAQAAHAPVWRYRMDSSPPDVPAESGGGHGLDGQMIWRADDFAGLDEPRARLSLAMAEAWAGFVRTGQPGAVEGAPGSWSRYRPDEQSTMILDPHPHLERAPRQQVLVLWEGRSWQPSTWWQVEGIS
jgi:para-nitrobenzyl esterase